MNVNARGAASAARAGAMAVAVAAAVVAAAAGCGVSSKAAGPASPAPSPSPASASGTVSPGAASNHGASTGGGSGSGSQSVSRCHTNTLAAHVALGQPGAGQRYADLVLTNTSGTTCRVYGFPGMQLVTATGAHVPTAVERVPGQAPLVTLAPGQQASSLLHWTIVPGTGEGSPCEPTAMGLIVTPPDETAPLHTSWPGGPVCQHGQIFATAFRPGANAS